MLLKLTGTFTDATLPTYKRDAVLSGDNGGILSLFDMAYAYSYAGGVPANGAQVANINESGNNGSIVLAPGQTIGFAGNGFDFSGLTKASSYFKGAPAAPASIWGDGTGPQYFMVCAYVKLPTSADWNPNAGLHPMLTFTDEAVTYQTSAELLLIAQGAGTKVISVRRQKDANAVDSFALQPTPADYGSFAQIAFWRNAAGQAARLRTANGTLLATAAVGLNNTQNFSAKFAKFGPAGGFAGVQEGALSASQQAADKWRLYRTFIENLAISGRDPAKVLDDDWARTVSRGVFS